MGLDRIQKSTFSEDLHGKRCLFGTFITKDTKCNSTLGFPIKYQLQFLINYWLKFESQIEKSEFHFEFKAKVSKSMLKFKFSTWKTANLQEIVPPNVKSGDQMVTDKDVFSKFGSLPW